jgi:hypothetical protein
MNRAGRPFNRSVPPPGPIATAATRVRIAPKPSSRSSPVPSTSISIGSP